MLRKIVMGAGLAYLARRMFGGRRSTASYSGTGMGWNRRGW